MKNSVLSLLPSLLHIWRLCWGLDTCYSRDTSGGHMWSKWGLPSPVSKAHFIKSSSRSQSTNKGNFYSESNPASASLQETLASLLWSEQCWESGMIAWAFGQMTGYWDILPSPAVRNSTSTQYCAVLPEHQDYFNWKNTVENCISTCEALLALAYNPTYSGGRDQKDQGSKPAWANNLQDTISKKI
jgi:hypothetical protein